jgi:hypothetical protein
MSVALPALCQRISRFAERVVPRRPTNVGVIYTGGQKKGHEGLSAP